MAGESDAEKSAQYSRAMRAADASFERMKDQAWQRYQDALRRLETNGPGLNGGKDNLSRIHQAEVQAAEGSYNKRVEWVINDYNNWKDGTGDGRLVRHHADNGFEDLGNR